MGRKPRVEYPGALYHVIQRGNNKEYIFDRAFQKKYMIEQIRYTVEMDRVEVLAFAIMSNHYHILMRTEREPLRKVMHRINTRFSKWYNHHNQRTGHVFEGRYKSLPIENENYLLAVIRYIHRNPVQASICTTPSDYQWSSDQYYRKNETTFVNTSLLLDLLADNRPHAMREYNLLMNIDDDTDWEDSNKWCQAPQLSKPEQQITRIINESRQSLDLILLGTGADPSEFQEVKNGSRKRTLQPYKVAFAREASSQGYSLVEIAKHIGISSSAIEKYLR